MRNDWSEEETLLAFAFYFNASDKNAEFKANNPKVIALAQLLGRTPSSVKMKLWNIASQDPVWTSEGRAGLPGAAKMIVRLWDEYSQDQMGFLGKISEHLNKQEKVTESFVYETIDFPVGHDIVITGSQRIGQNYFRRTLFENYSGRCCMTGIELPKLLVASHIKPWKDADDKTEKLNPQNGLLLNALHDKAFDKGLITIDNNLRIRVSPVVQSTPENQRFFLSLEGQKIALPKVAPPAEEFIEYHNDCIFLAS